ncbi:MAG: hypothetical protein M1814_002384 [Vezdaea aestivalis]|nr:MAG: hypothetical protein M1814_002384 [Vezdaea aestivalis]
MTSPNDSYKTYSKTYIRSPPHQPSLSRPTLTVEERVILITEGARGVGFILSQAFARAGAQRIIITGSNQQELIMAKSHLLSESPSSQIHPYVWDFTNENVLNRIFDDVYMKFGAISLVAHCAANENAQQWQAQSSSLTYLSSVIGSSERNTTAVAKAFGRTAVSLDAVLLDISIAGIQLPKYPGFGAYITSQEAESLSSGGQSSVPSTLSIVTLHPGLGNLQTMNEVDQLGGCFAVWLGTAEGGALRDKFVWATWEGNGIKINQMEESGVDPLQLRLNGWD